MLELKRDLGILIRTAIEAGKGILEVYEKQDFQVEMKEDHSPLTMADKVSHDRIVQGLDMLESNIPILSEEGSHIHYDNRKDYPYLWLIDPLDGTKEFIKRNGEFTVNIALTYEGKAIFGIIYAPVYDVLYFGGEVYGAYKLDHASALKDESYKEVMAKVSKLPLLNEKDHLIAIASRSHLSGETEEFIQSLQRKHGEVKLLSAGSSLKFCLIAEGRADVYPRFAPTMEWDTAAGHAIVEGAKGVVVQSEAENPLVYNKEKLLNPWFIVRKAGFIC